MAVTAQEMVDLYLEAERNVLAGKETWFAGRKIVMADLPQIIAGRESWERRLAAQVNANRGRSGFALATFE